MSYGLIYRIINILNNKSYIGQTTKTGATLEKYYGSGIHIKRAIKKYGIENFRKEILAFADSKEKLDYLEIEYIAIIKPEYNIANGGQGGNLGELVNIRKRGPLNYMYGNTHSFKVRKILSDCAIKQFRTTGHPRATRIICIEKEMVFNTIQEAAKTLKLNFSHIGAVCRKERRTTGKLHFIYESEYLAYSELERENYKKSINDENLLWSSTGFRGKSSHAVYCLETNILYKSITEASNNTGADKQSLYECCIGKRITSNKFHWMYENDYNNSTKEEIEIWKNKKDDRPQNNGKNPYVSKSVKCLNTNIIYESATAAMKATGINNSLIGKCANGQVKYAGKMVWEWVKNDI